MNICHGRSRMYERMEIAAKLLPYYFSQIAPSFQDQNQTWIFARLGIKAVVMVVLHSSCFYNVISARHKLKQSKVPLKTEEFFLWAE